MFCLHVHLCTTGLPGDLRGQYKILWDQSYVIYEPLCGCWKSNPGPRRTACVFDLWALFSSSGLFSDTVCCFYPSITLSSSKIRVATLSLGASFFLLSLRRLHYLMDPIFILFLYLLLSLAESKVYTSAMFFILPSLVFDSSVESLTSFVTSSESRCFDIHSDSCSLLYLYFYSCFFKSH